MRRSVQVTVGSLSGVTVIALVFGVVAARLGADGSAVTVAAGVTIIFALVGGFLAGPCIQRLTGKDEGEGQDVPSSSAALRRR